MQFPWIITIFFHSLSCHSSRLEFFLSFTLFQQIIIQLHTPNRRRLFFVRRFLRKCVSRFVNRSCLKQSEHDNRIIETVFSRSIFESTQHGCMRAENGVAWGFRKNKNITHTTQTHSTKHTSTDRFKSKLHLVVHSFVTILLYRHTLSKTYVNIYNSKYNIRNIIHSWCIPWWWKYSVSE